MSNKIENTHIDTSSQLQIKQ